MSSPEDCNVKLQQVLQLFLLPDYKVATTTYLDLLLTQIKQEITNDNEAIFRTCYDWLSTAFNTWSEQFKPCQSVTTFTIKLIGFLSTKEPTFKNLYHNDIPKQACCLFDFNNENLSASVKMAFTTMFVDLLEHESGRRWIEQIGAWKPILKFAQTNQTMYVTRLSHKFLSELLLLEFNNRTLCSDIIIALTEPLRKATENTQISKDQITLDKNLLREQNYLLASTVAMLQSILEYTTFHDLENTVPKLFEEVSSLESRVNVLFEVSISTPLMECVHRLAKLLVFTKLREAIKVSGDMDCKVFEQFYSGLCYVGNMLLLKKYISEIIVSVKLNIIYWKKLTKLKHFEVREPYKFENQGVVLMILPLCVTMKPEYTNEHFFFEQFVDKLFDLTCTPVQRLAYDIRNILLKNEFPLENICKSTVDHMLEIIDIMDREAAVLIFQVICHTLKNIVSESKNNATPPPKVEGSCPDVNCCGNVPKRKVTPSKHFLDGDPINDKPILLAALLNGLNVLSEKFKLKWKECVETICVLSIAQDILNHPGVNTRICILALKTCNVAIQNLMPPNLALLVDCDDQTGELGPILYKRLHDTNWEVQDSVFEILQSITYLSENKYPPYQSLLQKNKFLEVAVDIVDSGSESYVRASALAFICKAVPIPSLWENPLRHLNLPDLAIKLVYNEHEAIVRQHAVTLINELYEHRHWDKVMISTMSQAMTVAAVLDLHWEVKINALQYWKHFILSHLTDQGMLDGHFPSVTFSKQHRKIVSLNETEIKKRLNKALDELARQNCLGILLATLNDESDLEVSKASIEVILDLRRILLEYKIHEPVPESPSGKDSAILDSKYVKNPTDSNNSTASKSNNVNNIIDEILDVNDTNLLVSIYQDSMKMNGDESEKLGKETFEYIASVTREVFLRKILHFDFDAYIKERSDWLVNHTTSFDSVLDDIIIVNSNKDAIMMDCY